MVDSTDHITPKTGLSPTVVISKNGGSFASASGAVSEVGNGVYALAGNATDRNTLGELVIYATAAGADPVTEIYSITDFDPFAKTVLGATQGAITWAQQKIVANVSQQGALDIYNSHQDGSGIYSHATTGAKLAGAFAGYGTGLEIKGDKYGLHIANIGNNLEAALRIVDRFSNGLYIGEQGTAGYRVQGYVSGYDSAILTNVEEVINEALNVTNALLTNGLDEFTDSAPKAMQLPPEEGA